MLAQGDIAALLDARHADPFAVLGLHADADGKLWLRALLPGRTLVVVTHRPALLDLRRVAGNNASRYEAAIRPYLARLRANFSVTARVVQTATGRLQVQRMARERGDDPGCVFLDEEEALNFLMATRGRAGR